MQNAWKSENAVKDMIHNRLFKSSRKIIIVIIIYFALKCKDERNKVNIQSEQGGKVVNQHWQPQLKHKNTNPQKSSTDPITVFHKFGIHKEVSNHCKTIPWIPYLCTQRSELLFVYYSVVGPAEIYVCNCGGRYFLKWLSSHLQLPVNLCSSVAV